MTVKIKGKQKYRKRFPWDMDKLDLSFGSLSSGHSQRYGSHWMTPKWRRGLWWSVEVLNRRWVKILVVAVVMVAMCSHLYHIGVHRSIPGREYGPALVCSEQAKHQSHHRRLVWEKACEDLNFPSHDDQWSPNYHFSDKAKRFSYCSVPEVGDTFWRQIIRYVNNASGTVRGSVFDIPRWQTYFVAPTLLQDTFGTTIRFVFSEDPYVRLWRMWVEKLYLNAFWLKEPHQFKYYSWECRRQISFSEFLSMITEQSLLDHPDRLHRAWRPQSYQCNYCHMRPDYFAKMDTFEEDTRCILHITKYSWVLNTDKDNENHGKSLNSKSNNYEMAALKFRYISYRHMHSLIHGALARWHSDDRHKNCISQSDLVQRLWHGFQLLGYIPMTANIPKTFWSTNEVTVESLLHECYDASLKWRGTSAKIRQERREEETRKLMVQAYKQVATKTMNNLQVLYREDFKLLDYPSQPEDLYDERYATDSPGERLTSTDALET